MKWNMKSRFKLGVVLVMLLGMFIEPCYSYDYQEEAAKNVAELSEAEMRQRLPLAKKEKEKLARLINSGGAQSRNLGGVDQAYYEASYKYTCAYIKEIEKRLKVIDDKLKKAEEEQKEKEKKEKAKQELQQTQTQDEEADRQRQAELEQATQEKMAASQAKYNERHKAVTQNAEAAREGNVALSNVEPKRDSNFKPVNQNMLDGKKEEGKGNKNVDVSGKFKNKKNEEDLKKKEELEKRKKELLNQTNELKKIIDELPVGE